VWSGRRWAGPSADSAVHDLNGYSRRRRSCHLATCGCVGRFSDDDDDDDNNNNDECGVAWRTFADLASISDHELFTSSHSRDVN